MRLDLIHRCIAAAAFAAAAFAAAAGASSAQTSSAPLLSAPLVYYGGAAGRLTMDRDDEGGNALVSALIDALKKPPMTLDQFGQLLAARTSEHAGGWQQPEIPRRLANPDWSFASLGEGKRVALVLINSDYAGPNIASLPGARRDAARIEPALSQAGFEVKILLNADDDVVRKALADFAIASASADVALVYLGGHGVQHARQVYWMMRDYPDRDAKWLATHALSIPEVSAATHAKSLNLILYGGCRDDPFIHE